jgi:hypothetical protein
LTGSVGSAIVNGSINLNLVNNSGTITGSIT